MWTHVFTICLFLLFHQIFNYLLFIFNKGQTVGIINLACCSDSIFHMEYIFHQHIKVFWNPKHKLGGGGAIPTLYPADSFCAVSDSSGKVILVNATLFPYFSDIIGNRHKNPFFQFYRYFLIVNYAKYVSNKKDLQFYRQCFIGNVL